MPCALSNFHRCLGCDHSPNLNLFNEQVKQGEKEIGKLKNKDRRNRVIGQEKESPALIQPCLYARKSQAVFFLLLYDLLVNFVRTCR